MFWADMKRKPFFFSFFFCCYSHGFAYRQNTVTIVFWDGSSVWKKFTRALSICGLPLALGFNEDFWNVKSRVIPTAVGILN